MAVAIPNLPAPTAAGKPDFHTLVLSCNRDGMEALRKGQSKAAFEQFKYAEAVLIANQAESGTSLAAVTCNNLGCYYKKVGKLHGALSYLRRALQMEVDLGTDEVTLAGTHLNICAILSKLEKHDKAVQHALQALELIDRKTSTADPADVSADDYSVLAIAYHNVAVERDLLQQYDKAAAAFFQGFQVAKRCLGEDHPLAVTLGKNAEAVLLKSQRMTKVSSATATARKPVKDADLERFTAGMTDSPSLPAVPSAKPETEVEEDPSMTQRTIRQDAAEWVRSEEGAWSSFAKTALGPAEARSPTISTAAEGGLSRPALPGQARDALRDARLKDLGIPSLTNTVGGIPFSAATVPKPPVGWVGSKKTPLAQALDGVPQNIAEIVDASRTGLQVARTKRAAPNDFRPNRMIKGSTRTSRVLQRSCAWNTTHNRDQVMQGRQFSAVEQQKNEFMRKVAAERIQRTWRAWYKYCQDNSDWLVTTWIAATMIQARWRCYHVKRKKLDKASTTIQRIIRAFLVRRLLSKRRKAIVIQRHARGVITRNRLRAKHRAAVKAQSLIRGFLGRRRVQKKRLGMDQLALTIQCAVRCHQARRRVQVRRDAAANAKARVAGAVNIQRIFRGIQGRNQATQKLTEYNVAMEQHRAATKLQAMARRDAAIKRVDKIRLDKFEEMNKAATTIRKLWKGKKTRRKYQQLMEEFARHVDNVITIQRYARGFLVRLRMWRQAVRAEEELWASLEIQRVWRGYLGRVKWEAKYEEVWQREMAAAMIARNIRGWLARAKVGRMRRRIARAEFERARKRFRAAQRIQALVRGVLVRIRFVRRYARSRTAAVRIQRVARGHALRKRLWQQVKAQKATYIEAHARGFLVKRRRLHLIARVMRIQRVWRRWLEKPPEDRDAAVALMKERKEQAAKIQQAFRKHAEKKEVQRIHKEDAATAEKPSGEEEAVPPPAEGHVADPRTAEQPSGKEEAAPPPAEGHVADPTTAEQPSGEEEAVPPPAEGHVADPRTAEQPSGEEEAVPPPAEGHVADPTTTEKPSGEEEAVPPPAEGHVTDPTTAEQPSGQEEAVPPPSEGHVADPTTTEKPSGEEEAVPPPAEGHVADPTTAEKPSGQEEAVPPPAEGHVEPGGRGNTDPEL